MTEAGEFTEEELVFIGEDVFALYPSSTAWLAGEAARTAVLKLGWRWVDGEIQYKKAWEREEAEQKLTPTRKTASIVKKIYESVHKELKFEMETSEDFESKTFQTLDYQCWLSGGELLYK